MTLERSDMYARAKDSVLAAHKKSIEECPEIAKPILSPKLIEDVLQTGLNFQFEESSQKIRQTIKMRIRSEMRKSGNLDSE